MIRFLQHDPGPPDDGSDPGRAPADLHPPGPSPDVRRMESLVDRIAFVAAHVDSGIYQLLVPLREFDALFQKCGGGTGFRTSGDWIAWRTGMSRTAARERIRVARALAGLPRVSKAMARGELSYSKVRAIVRAAPMDPATEETLLDFALHGTACHLERLVRSWRSLGRLAEEEKAERARHESRYLSLIPGEDGSWVIRGRLDPETGALLNKALEMGVETLYRRSRLEDALEEERTGQKPAPDPAGEERVDAGQRRADALGLVAEAALRAGAGNTAAAPDDSAESRDEAVAEAKTAATKAKAKAAAAKAKAAPTPGCGSDEGDSAESRAPRRLSPDTRSDRFQVVVHVDLDTLRGQEDEADPGTDDGADDAALRRMSPRRFAFLDDHLRVSAETARRLSCDSGRVVMVHDGKGHVLDVGRKTRTVPPALARAVRFRDQGRCRFPGCSAPGRDHHHAEHWAEGGETKLENLALLCWFHHRAVHEGGFRMEATRDGSFRFLRPDGAVIPPVPPPTSVPADQVGRLLDRLPGALDQEDADHRIGPWTATPDWDGSNPDLNLILPSLPPWADGGGNGEAPPEERPK